MSKASSKSEVSRTNLLKMKRYAKKNRLSL
jgi:hypothetical protein